MKLILAADNDWAIGREGGLLARLPEDMKFFRETTTGHAVVMGRKTWESFPKRPLPDRENFVLSRTLKQADGAKVFGSVEEFLEFAKDYDGEIYVIGGGDVYKQLLPYCDTALITRVYECFGGDTFFTDIDALPGWEIAETSPVIKTDCYNIRFFKYVRKA